MKKQIFTIFISALLIASNMLQAQNNNQFAQITTSSDIDYNFEFDWDDSAQPMIELNYGFSNFKHKNFGEDFSNAGITEIKLGYSSVDEYYKAPILEFHDKFLFVSHISDDLSSASKDDKTKLSAWRFGFANRNGYGYRAGKISILPYDQNGFVWSNISSERLMNSSPSQLKIIDRYEDTFRFGSQAEGGVRIDYNDFISINAGYEATVIFPRHLFWKWAGSEVIKYIGLGALSYFTDEIIESTPEAGPIINFVLQNAFAYGFYSLQRNKMNWPFSSETPLTLETFKIGMSFTF
ncbi:MAG: hypothetical protein HND52_04365 [Ignavibacteriae bacterium]|jgi:hypothetical protein|nr:hypothetical protein [Ignavibacteriota bacterium]NOG97192.1 hypothetical protein [Ignavibacteriota bacterium]